MTTASCATVTAPWTSAGRPRSKSAMVSGGDRREMGGCERGRGICVEYHCLSHMVFRGEDDNSVVRYSHCAVDQRWTPSIEECHGKERGMYM